MDVERRLAKLNTASDQQRQFYRWNRVDATDSIIVELSSRGVRRKVRNVEILVERCSSLPDISRRFADYTRATTFWQRPVEVRRNSTGAPPSDRKLLAADLCP